jgi:hypothetical protein
MSPVLNLESFPAPSLAQSLSGLTLSRTLPANPGPTPSPCPGPRLASAGPAVLPFCPPWSLDPGSQPSPRTKLSRTGAAAQGTLTQPRRPTSPKVGVPGRPLSAGAVPWRSRCAPAVRAVWPRSGPLLLTLEPYKILIIKKARRKKESLHSPTPKSIFQGGGTQDLFRRRPKLL